MPLDLFCGNLWYNQCNIHWISIVFLIRHLLNSSFETFNSFYWWNISAIFRLEPEKGMLSCFQSFCFWLQRAQGWSFSFSERSSWAWRRRGFAEYAANPSYFSSWWVEKSWRHICLSMTPHFCVRRWVSEASPILKAHREPLRWMALFLILAYPG